MDRKQLLSYLQDQREDLRRMELLGPRGQVDERKAQKLEEVAGFCAVILRYVDEFLRKADPVRVLECSCGKSYLGFALCRVLEEFLGKKVSLLGIDSNPELIEKCRALARDLELKDAEFVCSRILNYRPDREFDLTVALHACDTATDQAVAKGIECGSHLVMVVPCCQNQIRGQIKTGHQMTPMTEYGPIRYRLANMLTDALRAQFLHAAGYHVEMDEIGSPRLTPKNLCICARKVKRHQSGPRGREYVALRDFFGVKPKIETYLPQVLEQEEPAETE